MPAQPWLVAGGHEFRSRLILGIEQYTSPELVGAVLAAGHCDVFITTFDQSNTRTSLLLSDLDDAMDLESFAWIGTTSFARSCGEAVDTARKLRQSFGIDVMKLDVRNSDNMPDGAQTIRAAEQLLAEGFAVLPFVTADLDVTTRLAEIGCSAIRVMASPVASARGIVDEAAVRQVIETVDVPVVVEGGLGTPEHVTAAMRLGAAAVLVNTAVAIAPDSALMAAAMWHAVAAGRLAVQAAVTA
jgi:thiazole synthase